MDELVPTSSLDDKSGLEDEAGAAANDTVIPVHPLLGRPEVECFRRDFFEEYEPRGPTECAIVADLARQAVAMDLWAEAAAAAERHAARMLPEIGAAADSGDEEREDAVLSGAMSSDAADRCERLSLGHERAFYRALRQLNELQTARRRQHPTEGSSPPAPFLTEEACEQYLAARLTNNLRRCDKCAATAGYYLADRRVWECKQCKLQTGLRAGTVMSRSPLSLLVWFDAVRWLLWRPTISATELAGRIGVNRLQTVSVIAGKIRHAMAQEDASARLAGLDRHYARAARLAEPNPELNPEPIPEPSASKARFFTLG